MLSRTYRESGRIILQARFWNSTESLPNEKLCTLTPASAPWSPPPNRHLSNQLNYGPNIKVQTYKSAKIMALENSCWTEIAPTISFLFMRAKFRREVQRLTSESQGNSANRCAWRTAKKNKIIMGKRLILKMVHQIYKVASKKLPYQKIAKS